MAFQWTWGSVSEDTPAGAFIRLCNRRLGALQQKVASLVSLPTGGGTANTIPRWDSTGTGLADSGLSDNGTRLRPASSRQFLLPNGVAGALLISDSGALERSVLYLDSSDDLWWIGAWRIAGSGGHLLPSADDAQDIGSSTKRVQQLYLSGDIEGGSGGFAHTIHGWYQDNVAASQTNVELIHAAGRWTAVRAGSVLGVVVHATEARTAGTLTVDVFKNTGLAGAAGSSIGLTAVLNGTDTSRKSTTQAKDTDTFAAGDELYAVVTTDGSWLPVTSDIRVSLLVEC